MLAQDSSNWPRVQKQAIRELNDYAKGKSPARFNEEHVRMIYQAGGEYEGNYLLTVNTDENFAQLLPLFDVCDDAYDIGMRSGAKWRVVLAKRWGQQF